MKLLFPIYNDKLIYSSMQRKSSINLIIGRENIKSLNFIIRIYKFYGEIPKFIIWIWKKKHIWKKT